MARSVTLPRWIVVCAVLTAAALPLFVSLPSKPNVIARLHDFAHAPLFAGLAVAVLWLLPDLARPLRYLAAFALAVATGAGIEILQSSIGRSGEWSDLATDALGAAGGLALAAAFGAPALRQRSIPARAAASALGLTLLLVAAWPFLNAWAAHLLRADRFPILLQSDTRLDAYFLRAGDNTAEAIPLPETWRRPGAWGAYRIHLRPVKWSGVSLFEPAPDWRGYDSLVLEFINPAAQPLSLTLRIHDQHHNQAYNDRFNRRIELAPGARTEVRIPVEEIAASPTGRRLDMAHIDGLGLFSSVELPPEGATFYLVAIRLR